MRTISSHPYFLYLSIETQRRVLIMEQYKGSSLRELANILGSSSTHINELNMDFAVRKGSGGVFVEQLCTGVRGNNECLADDGIVDIKGIFVPLSTIRHSKYDLPIGYKLKENLRLTFLNPQEIQTQPFEDSGLFKKSLMLIVLCEYDNTISLSDRKFIGFAFLDLRPHLVEIRKDYETVAAACCEGQAHLFKSSKKQICQFVKLYSNGQKNNTSSYTDKYGNKCSYKGKSFYLFKDKLVELLDII